MHLIIKYGEWFGLLNFLQFAGYLIYELMLVPIITLFAAFIDFYAIDNDSNLKWNTGPGSICEDHLGTVIWLLYYWRQLAWPLAYQGNFLGIVYYMNSLVESSYRDTVKQVTISRAESFIPTEQSESDEHVNRWAINSDE